MAARRSNEPLHQRMTTRLASCHGVASHHGAPPATPVEAPRPPSPLLLLPPPLLLIPSGFAQAGASAFVSLEPPRQLLLLPPRRRALSAVPRAVRQEERRREMDRALGAQRCPSCVGARRGSSCPRSTCRPRSHGRGTPSGQTPWRARATRHRADAHPRDGAQWHSCRKRSSCEARCGACPAVLNLA